MFSLKYQVSWSIVLQNKYSRGRIILERFDTSESLDIGSVQLVLWSKVTFLSEFLVQEIHFRRKWQIPDRAISVRMWPSISQSRQHFLFLARKYDHLCAI